MTATGIPYFVIGLVVISLLYMAFGPVMDGINDVHKSIAEDPTLATSNEQVDTFDFGRLIFENIPIIVFVGFCLALIIEAIAEHSGGAW